MACVRWLSCSAWLCIWWLCFMRYHCWYSLGNAVFQNCRVNALAFWEESGFIRKCCWVLVHFLQYHMAYFRWPLYCFYSPAFCCYIIYNYYRDPVCPPAFEIDGAFFYAIWEKRCLCMMNIMLVLNKQKSYCD